MDEQQFHIHCILCGSTNIFNLPDYTKTGLLQCRECGFTFCKKIPTEKELRENYRGYDRKRKISPITIGRYHEWLDMFEGYRKNNRILEVGCGSGHFLYEAKNRGWDVLGIEFDEDAVSLCKDKGIDAFQGTLSQLEKTQNKFDVIVCVEVIEHLMNLQADFTKIGELARGDGALFITTPNFNSITRVVLKENWECIAYPEHLNYFTQRTLTNFLKTNGFGILEMTSTGISPTRLKQFFFKQKVNRQTISHSDEGLRLKTETNSFFKYVKAAINGLLTLIKGGDTIKCLAIKKSS
ncbi:MAG: class I SAM-dependent methyltransferase [Nitrospinae bacterium]|nr:class I SAM-dependent methyltransferase [Nitrospinota bacterium]